MSARPRYQKKAYTPKKRTYVNKTKAMVTGNPQPTYLERIAQGAGSVAQLARAVAPMMAAINTEAKYFDKNATVAAYTPGTSDQLIDLTSEINQGLTDVQRIGDSVLHRNITVKVTLNQTMVAAGQLSGMSRVILMVWKENLQSNPPTIAKIFRTPGSFISAFNKDYTDQMVILKDKIFSHNAGTATSGNFDYQVFKCYKKLEYHARWLGPNTTDGTVNHIYLIIRGNGATSANAVNAEYWSRLNFTDN